MLNLFNHGVAGGSGLLASAAMANCLNLATGGKQARIAKLIVTIGLGVLMSTAAEYSNDGYQSKLTAAVKGTAVYAFAVGILAAVFTGRAASVMRNMDLMPAHLLQD